MPRVGWTDGGGQIIAGENSTFSPRTERPGDDNRYYISNTSPNPNGILGWNTVKSRGNSIAGVKNYTNVLPNCVSYALGRFNEIVGANSIKYRIKGNAKDFITWDNKVNGVSGLLISNQPTLGGIMVWSNSGAGHVAIVEAINEDGTEITISESNYYAYPGTSTPAVGSKYYFQTRTVRKINNKWNNEDYTEGLTFKGCIVNPAVTSGAVVLPPLTDYAGMTVPDTGGPFYSDSAYSEFAWPDFSTNQDKETYTTRYQEVSTTVRRDTLKHTDENLEESHSTNLLTYPTNVEAPFITLKIGDYTFGSYMREGDLHSAESKAIVTYPNFLTGIQITKVNGTVNQYTINMIYQIQAGEDPNFLDKVFSSVGYGTVYISYGDWNSPSFIYKEEEAIITKLSSRIDFTGSKIEYTLECTSNSLTLLGGSYNFSARHAKPSDVIFEMLSSNSYGLKDVFYGMTNETQIRTKGLIATDDQAVDLEAKVAMDPLSYLNYLVTCMTAIEDNTDSPIKTSTYFLTIYDDVYGEMDLNGPYFTVKKVKADGKTLSIANTYEVDIGFPGDTMVMNFTISDDNSWALLYDYSEKVSPANYVYHLNDEGEFITEFSPALTTSTNRFRTTQVQKDWWTNMTQFPISAELEIKGLMRPAMLMTYVRVNAFFFGKRHSSSGLYIITKQQDTVDGNGYRTKLSLTRVAGDQDWFETNTETVTATIAYREYK